MSGTVVFLHAHPDDEAIFTGGTILALVEAGWRVVLVVATDGRLGVPTAAAEPPSTLAHQRARETREACAILGVHRVEHLGYADSGLPGDPANRDPHAFAAVDEGEAAARVAALLVDEAADALVVYDDHGIYGHPDHVAVHRVGRAAAERTGTPHVYEVTVDREYLHFVETHLVIEAGAAAAALGLAGTAIGTPTVLVDTTLDVHRHLPRKRAAMAAHRSQIPETAAVLALPDEAFAAVYGFEWYLRSGPPGPLESL